jgi:AAA+ ATPase superfamily predicted ATPase
MPLPFLDRKEERARLSSALRGSDGAMAVLYGRRRCGKSRLLQEVLPARRAAYYVGDDREGSLQRASLAAEVERLLPGFAAVRYPDWESLLERLWREAPRAAVIALDEFPSLVAADPALPSLLQKLVDRRVPSRRPHLVLCGSSQRLMQGLVLDRSAPLFGRAREILKISPLPAGFIKPALRLRDDVRAVEAFAFWGGIPRYWELAAPIRGAVAAFEQLALSPLGVLHDEPRRLLLDDVRDTTQPLSVLALIGAGCHRLSEIAARLGRPATSLARPLATLVELGLVRRALPFGASLADSKRTAYRLADPFLRAWFRFVEPNRSRLEAGLASQVACEVERSLAPHVSSVWEDLVREAVPRATWSGRRWGEAASWWGPGLDRKPLELDVVAQDADEKELLVGEVKWQDRVDWPRELGALRQKAARLPLAVGRTVRLAIWSKRVVPRLPKDVACYGPKQVLAALLGNQPAHR